MRIETARLGRPRDVNRSIESGSAYLVALLALLVLSIIALSVATISQGEMMIGAGERTTTKNFYDADGGLDLSVAYVLQNGTCASLSIDMGVPGSSREDPNNPGQRIQLGTASLLAQGLEPLNYAPCDYCEANQSVKRLVVATHFFESDVDYSLGPNGIARSNGELLTDLTPVEATQVSSCFIALNDSDFPPEFTLAAGAAENSF